MPLVETKQICLIRNKHLITIRTNDAFLYNNSLEMFYQFLFALTNAICFVFLLITHKFICFVIIVS